MSGLVDLLLLGGTRASCDEDAGLVASSTSDELLTWAHDRLAETFPCTDPSHTHQSCSLVSDQQLDLASLSDEMGDKPQAPELPGSTSAAEHMEPAEGGEAEQMTGSEHKTASEGVF